MYLTVSQPILKSALALVAPLAESSKTSLPILKYLRLIAEPGQEVLVSAANEETTMQARFAAEVQAGGTLLLPAQLASFVSDLPAASVTLAAPSPTDPTAVLLRCQHITAQFKVGAMPVEEFPQISWLTDDLEEFLVLDAELLKEIVTQVAFAASDDLARPVLSGVRVMCAEGRANFAAADAFRLAIRSIAIPDQKLTAGLLIPAQALKYLARLLPAHGFVRLACPPDGQYLLFQTPTMALSVRLLEGAYPNVGQAIPQEVQTRVILKTEALSHALTLMQPFTRENGQEVQLMIADEHPGETRPLHVQAHAADLGINTTRLDATVSGPAIEVRVKVPYLREAVAVVPTEQVALEFSGPRRPLLVRPVGALQALHVIMPLIGAQTPPASPAQPTHGSAHLSGTASSR